MSYNIAVIGTGYVGLVTGTSFATNGNNVICVDIDENKISTLSSGKSTIYEPGLEYYLKQSITEKRIKFTTNLAEAVLNSQFVFLCLPTPPNEDGSADLHHVLETASDIANIFKKNNIKDNKIIINKSTVPVGTAEKVKNIFNEILDDNKINVVSNPEFLREGYAVEDALKPERVVIGTDDENAAKLLKDLYVPFVRSGNPIIILDVKSAELTKYAANSFLAMKISFMNDLSNYCEKIGADIEKIRLGIGTDSRIGKRFLFPGIGFGGSCFPKDVRALIYSAQESGVELKLVKAAQEVNNNQIARFSKKVLNKLGENKKIAIWGLSFKPNTDDIREAPAFKVINELLKHNYTINVYDPEAIENTKSVYGDKINYFQNQYDCLEGCEALLIITEWSIFRNPDYNLMSEKLKSKIIFDGRNLFEPKEMNNLGFEYYCIGRN